MTHSQTEMTVASKPYSNSISSAESIRHQPAAWRSLPWLSWLNVTSLDAPLVAVAWQWCFTVAFDVPCRWYHLALLGLMTWIVYAADRIGDGRRLNPQLARTRRHAFHDQFCAPLAAIWLAALGCGVVLVLEYLDLTETIGGMIVLGCAILHCLVTPHSRSLVAAATKEARVAILFSIGVTWAIWSRSTVTWIVPTALLAALLFWANCLVIATIERPFDQVQGVPSGACSIDRSGFWIYGLLAVTAVISLAVWAGDGIPGPLGPTLVTSAGLLAALFHQRHRFDPETCTALAESALILPAALWTLANVCV